MNSRDQRIAEIFGDACELPPAERTAFLDQACSGDQDLRAEIDSLIEQDQEDSAVLPRSCLEASQHRPGLLAPMQGEQPDSIGRYRIVEQLGAGGMGVVYRAEQENPSRPVALKVIRPGFLSEKVVKRFEYEVSVLGRLQHPGIAQIYEAGWSDSGHTQPFFAMELVEGRSLLAYAEGLDERQRLELIAQIAEAVHHAHQKGIIHRDIKPSNILVDSSGQPKLIDFGVARATESDVALTSLHTNVGQVIGTLQYMSPEQCESDPDAVDLRTDVYSIGMVMYELLCRRLPYEIRGLTIVRASHMICEQLPERPGAISRSLRGDIEAILLKSIAKKPAERYQSAAGLARDIRRHLASEPIDARAPTPWSVVARWIERHPVLTSAAACTLVGALILSVALQVVRNLQYRPYRVIQRDSRSATLESRSGVGLKSWFAGDRGRLVHAGSVERPQLYGGGEVAVIAFSHGSTGPHSGHVCLFDFADPADPYWTSAESLLELPPTIAPRSETGFDVQIVRLADCLPSSPGPELLVVHRLRPYSQCAIRIFDLGGGLRYETWHDGPINSVVWLRAARRAVFSAPNCAHRWDQRGVDAGAETYPTVVFALELLDGHIARSSFLVQAEGAVDETLAWYKWLGPASELHHLGNSRGQFSSTPAPQWPDDRFITWNLSFDGQAVAAAGFKLILDASGREVGRFSGDGYKQERLVRDLPEMEVYRLLDYKKLPLPVPDEDR